MTNPRRYSLFMIGAAVLATGAPVLADTGPQKQPEVATVEMGPLGPTPAEIAKLEAITAAQRAAAPATDPAVLTAPIVSPPVAEKKAEVTTIVIGPAGLTRAEQAKVIATAVPTPAPATPAPAGKE